MQSKVKTGTMMFVTKLAYSTYVAHILYHKAIFLFSPLPICQRKYLPVPPFLVIISPLPVRILSPIFVLTFDFQMASLCLNVPTWMSFQIGRPWSPPIFWSTAPSLQVGFTFCATCFCCRSTSVSSTTADILTNYLYP